MATNSIVFYDGLCGLCDRSVQFIIKHDHQQRFRFAALQSPIAKQYLGDEVPFDSFILFVNGKVFTKSTAALNVLKQLGVWWKVGYLLIIIPPVIRNAIYDFVARNRYKWFGKFDSCKIPTVEQRGLFLD